MKTILNQMLNQLKQIQPFLQSKRVYSVEYSILGLILFWIFFIHYNDSYHFSISRNFISGETKIDTLGGIKISAPWVQVVKIDHRPFKVCVECSCKNMNCVLISFNKKGWDEFIKREGFRYYWFSNRISFNFGNDNEYRGLKNVLRGYAFDNTQYSFITKSNNIQ